MKKIAQEARVSVSTVSKAFSYSKEISEATRERIFDIAKKYDSLEKYTLQKYSKKVIVAITPEINGGFYTNILSLLNDKIKKRGGILNISISDFEKENVKTLYEYHTKYQKVDGVLIIGSNFDVFNLLNTPTVFMLGNSKGHIDAVGTSIKESIYEVVRNLKKSGHKNIAFIGEKLTESKKRYFEEAMNFYSMPLCREIIETSKYRFEKAGYEGAKEITLKNIDIDAIITAYDKIAIGAIKFLKESGFTVPDDISVIGMDDIQECEYLDVPLTSIKTNVDLVCEKALDILYRKMDNQFYFSNENIVVKSELVNRKSVKNKTI